MNKEFDARAACASMHEQIIELRRQDNLFRWSLKAIIKDHPPFATAVERMLEANIANMLPSDLKDQEIERVQKFLDDLQK
jgi:hypothetical protein